MQYETLNKLRLRFLIGLSVFFPLAIITLWLGWIASPVPPMSPRSTPTPISSPLPSPLASARPTVNVPPSSPEDERPSQNKTLLIISLLSLATSATTLVGFVSTTLLAWRKEGRDSRTGFLDIQLKELEIQKRQQELRETKPKLIDEPRRNDERTRKKRRRKNE
jgi:hypothetical protein